MQLVDAGLSSASSPSLEKPVSRFAQTDQEAGPIADNPTY
jgi:hypothetical protein